MLIPDLLQGKRGNFCHPCIRALCVEFFYGPAGGKEPLAKLFPEDFSTSIPEHAVAAAMTCVSLYQVSHFYTYTHHRSTTALTSIDRAIM